MAIVIFVPSYLVTVMAQWQSNIFLFMELYLQPVLNAKYLKFQNNDRKLIGVNILSAYSFIRRTVYQAIEP